MSFLLFPGFLNFGPLRISESYKSNYKIYHTSFRSIFGSGLADRPSGRIFPVGRPADYHLDQIDFTNAFFSKIEA